MNIIFYKQCNFQRAVIVCITDIWAQSYQHQSPEIIMFSDQNFYLFIVATILVRKLNFFSLPNYIKKSKIVCLKPIYLLYGRSNRQLSENYSTVLRKFQCQH